MESIFSRYKNALVLMLVLLAQVVLLAMQVRRPAPDLPDGHNVRLWRYWVASVVTPPERLAHNIGLGLRGVWSNYIYLRNLREQNLKLQEENDRLHLEQASLAEDAREGQRLREMLDFKGRYIDKTVPAQVIGTSGTDQAHVIYIDKGTNDGLKVQMPVITPDGIVGKIKNVFPGTAQVLLISDQTSGAGVMLQTTRIRGVMKGNASGEPQIINISPDDRIKSGEPVLTSGGDQVYPRGLPVGQVVRVVPDPDTSYVNVVVKPYANLSKLEEVLVITEISDKMPFTQEKDILQSEVDALAEKQRAADILSEKLPSLRDEDAPSMAPPVNTADGEAAAGGGDPGRPMRPPQPLHPDRYTPGSAPPATSLTPGAAPAGLHRDIAPTGGAPSVARSPRPSGAESSPVAAGGEAAPLNRFPPKAAPAAAAGAEVKPGAETIPPARPTANASGAGTVAPKLAARPSSNGGSGNGGLGFALPLQPATSGAARPAPVSGGAVGTSGGATVVRSPRPPAVVGGGAGLASGTVVPRPVQRPTAQSPAAVPGARRIVIPPGAEAGGILTPAGMGQSQPVARPKAVAPGTTTLPSPGAAKPATPRTQTAPGTGKPQQTPGARTNPPPPKPPPPGGN